MASEQVRLHRPITAHLVEGGVVTPEQVEVALARQRETGRRIGESLVELGFVSEEDIGWALARQLGIPFVDVRPENVDADLVRSFPEGSLRRLQVVPLFRSDAGVTAAVADPTDLDSLRELERLCDVPTSTVAATPTAIERVLDAILGRAARPRTRETEPPDGIVTGVAWERSGETFLGFHLQRARSLGVGELRFDLTAGGLQVSHRAGTRLAPVAREPASVADALLARFEALGMPPLAGGDEHRDFTATCRGEHGPLAIRVSVLATRSAMSASVRLLRDPDRLVALETLGLEPLDVAQLRETLQSPSGIVIVSGPPGAGCSTTLGALLAECPMADRRWAVFCEDPLRRPPAPAEATVVTGALARRWRRIASAHALDGLVIDGGLGGRRLGALATRATHGRWVLARTDWGDSFDLIEWLAGAPGGRVTAGRQLLAVIQQRLVATPAANVAPAAAARTRGAVPPGPGGVAQRAVFEVLHVGDRLRSGVLAGAGASGLRAIAAASGFRPLGEHLQEGVRLGRLDARDAARAGA